MHIALWAPAAPLGAAVIPVDPSGRCAIPGGNCLELLEVCRGREGRAARGRKGADGYPTVAKGDSNESPPPANFLLDR